MKLDWDEPLQGELPEEWKKLVLNLQQVPPITIARCYFNGISEPVISHSLIGFCDASLKLYAAVIYLKIQTVSGYSIRLVSSKTRVAPVGGQTIPRLELLAALLLAKLISSVHHTLETKLALQAPLCFTDSSVALGWIRSQNKDWKQFVQNRVNSIRKLVGAEYWRHCPGLKIQRISHQEGWTYQTPRGFSCGFMDQSCVILITTLKMYMFQFQWNVSAK